MRSPNWRMNSAINLLKKNRHIVKYLSVFLFLIFLLLVISSSKPINNLRAFCNYPGVKDTIYVFDTIIHYDTAYIYDTVYLSNLEYDLTNIISKWPRYSFIEDIDTNSFLEINRNLNLFTPHNYLFSIDFFASPLYSLHSLTSDYIYKEALDANMSALKPGIGNNYGIDLNLHVKKSILTSGINIANFNESFIDYIDKYKYFINSFTEVDTVRFINIDTLLATGDTLFEYYYDTTQFFSLDSSLIVIPDSLKDKFTETTENRYTYIEIPLKYSFTIYKKGFSLSPTIGIITSFFVNSKGKIVSLANLNQTNSIKNETKLAAVNLSFYSGIKFNYYITDKIDFFTTAFYRQNINSIFRDYPLISRYYSFGINVGIRYKILY